MLLGTGVWEADGISVATELTVKWGGPPGVCELGGISGTLKSGRRQKKSGVTWFALNPLEAEEGEPRAAGACSYC